MPSSYREQPAPAGLAGVVACLWRHEITAAREQRVLPDGCMDLIWMDGAVHVAGSDSRAFLATMRPHQVVTGLRFRPGAAPACSGCLLVLCGTGGSGSRISGRAQRWPIRSPTRPTRPSR
ncbi:MAG: DUF6597 domain-containing transcriptional factor [Pseudonocardiaceae bacterium]